MGFHGSPASSYLSTYAALMFGFLLRVRAGDGVAWAMPSHRRSRIARPRGQIVSACAYFQLEYQGSRRARIVVPDLRRPMNDVQR